MARVRTAAVTSRAWMHRALCREVDPAIFFLDKGGSPVEAKSVCARCPVLLDCKDFALNNPVMGVWAGTTETERRKLGVSTTPIRVALDSPCKSPWGYERHLRRGEQPCADCTIAMQYANAATDKRRRTS